MRKLIALPKLGDLRVQFEYDEETGVLQYRKRLCRSRQAGGQAGHMAQGSCDPYWVVLVEYPASSSKSIFAHRVIWKLMTGREPPNEIDHIDGNTLNNAWSNLRDGTDSVNQKNRAMSRRNTSGHCGVYWNGGRKKWVAEVMANGKKETLGYFEEKAEAADVARKARDERGFTDRHGMKKRLAK